MRTITLPLITLCVLLAGCDHTVNRWKEDDYSEAKQNSNVTVKPSVASLSLSLQNNGKLSEEHLDDLNELLNNQGRIEQQYIKIQPLTLKGTKFARYIKSSLLESGAIPDHVSVLPIVFEAATKNVRKVDFIVTSESLVVQVPECAIADADTWAVKPYEAIGFLGCANRANLAKMVADPRDLVRGQALATANGAFAERVISDYEEGDTPPLIDIDFED